jgi:hypothetical protein
MSWTDILRRNLAALLRDAAVKVMPADPGVPPWDMSEASELEPAVDRQRSEQLGHP